MSRSAPRVHAEQAVIARMEQIARQLPQDSRVELRTDRGECFRGMVSATPTVQSFYDGNGREGLNGVVRLEAFLDDGRAHQGGQHYLWLDEIEHVERLPNPSPPEDQASEAAASPRRAASPDSTDSTGAALPTR